ncbi:hypothetical protein OHW85_23105, partial [Acinetobacter baumannii]|nr:hypothetical protein [Acinetobacter baumannii]
INATQVSEALEITISEFERRMKRLATCSLSVIQQREVLNKKTGRKSFQFVHSFSTKLVSEYVSYEKNGEMFYSFNYSPFFERLFHKSNEHQKTAPSILDQVV